MKRLTLLVATISFLIFPSIKMDAQIGKWDHDILHAIQQKRTPAKDATMRWVSNSLILAPAAPIALGITGTCCENNALINGGIQSGSSLLFTGGFTMGLKYIVGRPRPYITHDDLVSVTTEGTPSFPSGHTSMAFSTATSLCLQYPKWYVIAPSLIWASAVSYSRMYLGVHYPSDVLVGVCIGAGSAFITYKVQQRLLEQQQLPSNKGFVIPITIAF